jgi:hypothetical protein
VQSAVVEVRNQVFCALEAMLLCNTALPSAHTALQSWQAKPECHKALGCLLSWHAAAPQCPSTVVATLYYE